MAGEVAGTAVCLDLDDDADGGLGGGAVHEEAAEQISRHPERGAIVKRAGERRGKAQRISTAKRMFFFPMPSRTMSRPPLRIIHSRR